MLLLLEWSGTIAAIIGAAIAATLIVKITYAWLFWIFTNICFMVLFLHTQQYGLFTKHFIGLFINIFGYYQWRSSTTLISPNIGKYLYLISLIMATIGGFTLAWFLIELSEVSLEWTGMLFSIAGSLALASRHKYSHICWPFWIVGGGAIIALSVFYTSQYGVLTQQLFYMVTNIIGLVKHYSIYREKQQESIV